MKNWNPKDSVTAKVVEKKGVKTGKPIKVLVMDDDPMILEMSEKILTRLGYQPVIAKNGEQAIQRYKKAQQENDPIRFVILDLEIKQGMGGVETIKALKKLDPDVTAIIASGYSEDKIMENCRDFGFALAIAKPYRMAELKASLKILSQPEIPSVS